MGFFGDIAESVGDIGLAGLEVSHAVPLLGEVVHGAEGVYHAGAAIYDGVTGDRDGAIHHGVEAAVGAVGAIPEVSEAVGAFQAGGAVASLGARGLSAAGVIDVPQDKIPNNAGAALGDLAVMGADTIWGKPKDEGHGTKGGEMATGFGAIGGVLGGALGPLGMAAGAYGGAK